MAYIGARLEAARRARKLTQDELAERTEIARTDISGIENNRISVGAERLGRLAGALEISVLELQPETKPDAPGLTLLDRQEALEANVRELTRQVERLVRQVGVLERRARPAAKDKAVGR
jgi:transcriptional regulator with XRE-family HTH domain